ncbi:spectrin beta chain-like [Corticium candelabrum]|uniref:spectrin beta chain-like n=1 Tax=Corticium candelabrum TaxID=121492 RepID=UPI002E259F0D|nr:spectrin beta chain-like [Corticium candelabrum]
MTARIEDLYTDLRDGRMLMKLLETLSGEKLPKPTRGNMRIHKMENTDKALMFLKKKNVTLENIAGHDIVDGNPRLTLGLIWTIILRFQIQDISVEEEGESQAVKSAKDALLLWCQRRTAGYNNVHVTNFSTSWRDGLAFNAIIHYHRPDLIYYEGLEKTQHKINLNNAFDVAERDLGLARLLDAEDVDVDFPDEKSVITYVATYYHYFSKMKSESIGGRRIAKVIGQAMDNERSCQQYERLTSELLQWIEAKIKELDDRSFPNSLPGMQGTLASFNTYRTQEKPPKFVEKGNLEVMLFDIQTKLRANNQRTYVPPEGKMIADINKTWARLEHAEHSRELAIRHETMRLERQEQLVTRFHRKVAMREAWLTENQRLIAVDDFGDDLTAVEAATQKHEAIETDIKSYEERVTSLGELARELTDANYHSYLAIRERHDHILRMWNKLLDSLADRRERLRVATSMYKTFQEMIDLLDYMEDVKVIAITAKSSVITETQPNNEQSKIGDNLSTLCKNFTELPFIINLKMLPLSVT